MPRSVSVLLSRSERKYLVSMVRYRLTHCTQTVENITVAIEEEAEEKADAVSDLFTGMGIRYSSHFSSLHFIAIPTIDLRYTKVQAGRLRTLRLVGRATPPVFHFHD